MSLELLNPKLAVKLSRIFIKEGWSGVCSRGKYRFLQSFPDLMNRRWVKRYTPSETRLKEMTSQVTDFNYLPTISVLLPVYNTRLEHLRAAIESVLNQVYPRWELCIADDASTSPEVLQDLAKYESLDDRIKVAYRSKNGHIAAASNSALELAEGDFIALLDHDDVLAPHALFHVAKVLNENSELDLLYSDEDKLDRKGKRVEPTFKASWDPEYFMSFMYIGHLAVYRRELVEQAGRFRVGFEGSQDYDLALRVTELTQQIAHIPEILYHWRKHPDSVAENIRAKPYAFKAAKLALEEALQRRGNETARIEGAGMLGVYRTRCPVKAKPAVELLLPAVAATQLVSRQLSLLCEKTDYDNFGICAEIVDNSGDIDLSSPGVRLLESCLLEDRERSSLTGFLRRAVETSQADFLVLMSGILEPASRNWVTRFLELSTRENVAVVGGKIVDQRRAFVHAGYVISHSRVSNSFYGYLSGDPGYAARLITVRNVSALSGCFITSREVLNTSGVLNEEYRSQTAFEIDLCLSARRQGGSVLWTPEPEFKLQAPKPAQHRDLKESPEDFEQLCSKHNLEDFRDPYYPPGLDLNTADYRVAI